MKKCFLLNKEKSYLAILFKGGEIWNIQHYIDDLDQLYFQM